MTVHAIPHIEVDIALRNRLVRDVAMARRAFDVGADVRRMIEPDVRALRITVDALPVQVDSLLGHLRNLLDARPVSRDGGMADEAGIDAGQASLRTLRHGLVMGLVGANNVEALTKAVTDESRAVRLGVLLAMRRLAHPEIARFLHDADPFIAFEAARAINDAPIPAALPVLASFIVKSPPTLPLSPQQTSNAGPRARQA